jgi:catechol 2,3-dioxygenase-like lactoylglutathione lyase family enzyme
VAIELNHTIVHALDPDASARFLADVLGLPPPERLFSFHAVALANGVTLDYARHAGPIASQHYAFLVTEDEFDAAFARLEERGIAYQADPHGSRPDEINTRDGGRGVYFDDPDGHRMELLTVPYGGWPDGDPRA